jgi:hypothetical protein
LFGFGAVGAKFGPINLKVGQIWEYREFQETDWSEIPPSASSYDDYVQSVENAVEILKIENESGFMGFPVGRTVLVRFVKSTSCPHPAPDEIMFAAENFGIFFRLLWDPDAEDKYGVYCGNCGQHYEYAKFEAGFKCWACRNGWTT